MAPDGTRFDGPDGLRSTLLRSDRFVSTLTEKMLTYALGRGLEYYDAPSVRSNPPRRGPGRLSFLEPDRRDRAERTVPHEESGRRTLGLMFITKKALPRRTFLRGVGATLGLPLLDAMVPALSALAQTPANPVKRLGFVYLPNGVARNFTGINYWTPTGEGAGFELSPILSPLAPYRNRLLVVSGLAQHQADAFDDGANGDHTRGTSSWLTGVHCKRTEGADVRNGVSADQIAAPASGPDDGAAVAGAGDRSQLPRRSVREQLQLRLPEHTRVELGYDAAADGEQSAHRVRAALRRWWHARAAPGAGEAQPEHPRLGHGGSCEAAGLARHVAIAPR